MSDEARAQFEKEYPPPKWAIKANGEAGRAIHFSHLKREWEGFEKGFAAGRLQGLEEAAKMGKEIATEIVRQLEEDTTYSDESRAYEINWIAAVISWRVAAAIREKKEQ